MNTVLVKASISLAQVEVITADDVKKEQFGSPNEVKKRIVQLMNDGYEIVHTNGDTYTFRLVTDVSVDKFVWAEKGWG